MVKQSLKCMVIERGKEVKFADVWAGGYWSMARASDGRVFAFGLNSYGQLGVSSGGAVAEAAAGNDAAAGDDAAMDVGGTIGLMKELLILSHWGVWTL